MIQSLAPLMQQAAFTDDSFDVGSQDNNAYIEAQVFFDAYAPMLSRYVLDNHEAVFNQLPPHLLTATNGKKYFGIEVQVQSWKFKEFSHDMEQLDGVLGLILRADATRAEYKQYGRHCFTLA